MIEIKALIVDDEFPARATLHDILNSISNVTSISECTDGNTALLFLKKHSDIDVIFLDIEMPEINGLDVAKKISSFNQHVKIIFATGYNQFAVQAFELEAFDYILKPYDEARIIKAIQRLIDSKKNLMQYKTSGEIIRNEQKIVLRSKYKTVILSPLQEIILISTEKSDSSLFYTTNGIIQSKMTLRDIEKILSPQGFFRTHKGYIVNLSKVSEIKAQDNSTLLLTMEKYPKEKVPVSRHYIKEFRNAIGFSHNK